jgi:hypothetical protein
VSAAAVLLLLMPFRAERAWFVPVGVALAGVALLAQVAASILELVPGVPVSRGTDFIWPYSALVLAASLGTFLAMLALGLAVRRRYYAARWSMVPLMAGLAPVPAAVTMPIHPELPVLLVGAAWAAAGIAVIAQGRAAPGADRP